MDTDGLSEKALVIDVNELDLNLGKFLMDLNKKFNLLSASVVRVIEVGHSYESLISGMDYQAVFNEYIAFTKLDLCDISVPEISAITEMKNKCMFLSGIDNYDDGLYFAKVDQIESFLLKKLQEEHG